MSASARAAPSPRLRQPWSPRHPSPLGLHPMGFSPLPLHTAFQAPLAYPVTPDRPSHPKGPSDTKVSYPAEARRPLRARNTIPQHPISAPGNISASSMPSMLVSPPSPTPSETSSLSLYSAESVHKNFPIDVIAHRQQQEEEEKPPALFCGCINFKAWFGSKAKAREKKILGPPAAPAPQMVQVRRRPPPLNM
ncbi:hypothetical protein CPB84DRAFT_1788076 [Gymnopilus junonius]|uniref:Uncharacterized protein n=1 Tax=Gymnopilus junonius TaxID=109634 RepID=A0A9P5NIW1_GYMJU|nr:hypothetical protein CPB84DRAFT_1788076 [Gymnopilus junonius]